ncbi:MAG: ATP-dependent helicase [Promethearchaeia archaeon]
MNDKEPDGEEYVFEYYEDDFAQSLEESPSKLDYDYNDIDFEEDLNEEQLEIVNNIEGAMLVIAGAGSGKTRTITYSVAKLLLSGVDPSEIMLVTFTNKAAKEMIKRVENLLGKRPKGIWAGTFHSIANRFLRQYAKTLDVKPNYNIMDETDAKSLMTLSIEEANVENLENRFPSAKMAKRILSYSINCDKSIKEVILWKYPQFDNDLIEKKLKHVYKIYSRKKTQDGLVDFDDLLVYWNKLLDKKHIARLIASRIQYVLVDEYQDTNHIQDEIIHKIVSQNPDKNVMVVGDDAQSIYAFRGANFENILNFEEKYDDCKVYKITYNYRSCPEILELANDSIMHNEKQYQKEMQPTRPNGLKPFWVNLSDDEEQAQFVANEILSLRSEDFDLNQIAVLFRSGFHSMKIELALQKYNIPYVVRAGVSFFEKAHIKDTLVHLRIIDNPYDEIAWMRIFKIVNGIGTTSGTKIFSELVASENPLKTVTDPNFFKKTMKGSRIPSKGWKNLIKHLTPLVDYTPQDSPDLIIKKIIHLLEDHVRDTYENWEERLDDLEELAIYGQQYDTLRKFLEILALNRNSIESKTTVSGDQTEEDPPVILSTIHRAKGLEWRVVFIPMLCEEYFPSHRVIGDAEEMEEERRVFYVAITRAKDRLYLLTPAIIQMWRKIKTGRPSRFIGELDPSLYKKSSMNFIPEGRTKSVQKKGKKGKKGKKAGFISAADLVSEEKEKKDF